MVRYRGKHIEVPANELNSDAANKVLQLLDKGVYSITELEDKTGFSRTHLRNTILKFEDGLLIQQVPPSLLPRKLGRPATSWTTPRYYILMCGNVQAELGEIVLPRKEFSLGLFSGQLSEFFEHLIQRESTLRNVRDRLAGIMAAIMRQSVAPVANMMDVRTDLLSLIQYLESLKGFCEEIFNDSEIWSPTGIDFTLLATNDRAELLKNIDKYAMLYDTYLHNLRLKQQLESLE